MNLPKRYALSVEVKLIELPDQFKEPEEPTSNDPMEVLASMGKRVLAVPAYPHYPQMPAGLDFRKSANVTVQSFGALTDIVLKFDELTQQIEAERP